MQENTNFMFMSAKGKLPYNMTNDYMFRIVLQRDRETLIGLVCSVLHLTRDEVLDVTIENPITPGEAIDAKDGFVYTDKFNLLVVELNHTNLATTEDKQYGIDTWARLFKATTWEEIKMITRENPSMNSAAESIYMSNSDEQIRELCRRREDAIAHENFQKKKIQDLTNENEALTSENEALASKNKALTSEIENLTAELNRLRKSLENKNNKTE